jgi:HSP20 family protein
MTMARSTHTPPPFNSDAWDLPGRMLQDKLVRGSDLPAVNIRDLGSHFTVEVAAPGYRKQDLKVNITNGVLTISSERREEATEGSETYSRREFHYSAFMRSFQLPGTADEENVQAAHVDGILRLTIGKRQASGTRSGRLIPIE